MYIMLISYLTLFGVDETLDAMQETGLTMKDRHFELATRNLTINPRNKDAVRRVMVNGEQIVQVAQSVGMHHTQLGKQVRRILQNFEKELATMGLSFEECVVDKDMLQVLRVLEDKSLASVPPPKKRRKRQLPPD
jgi:hypothetical protein